MRSYRRPLPAFGRWESVPGVRSLRMSRSTTFEWCVILWRERSERRKNRLVPFCMFTDPELARVGLNEKEARSRGLAYRLCKLPMTANLRARTLSETRGFMKALIAKESDQILGFTIFGVEAGEVISVAQTAMLGEMPYTVMRDAIYTHPTIAEGLNVLFR